jgi:prepilin-type N-terminal cleavage/methylation domain-containing protein
MKHLPPQNKRSQQAFSLVEMMVVMGLSSMVLIATASIFMFCTRSMASIMNYTDMEAQCRYAMDTMTAEIRQCVTLTSYATNDITLADANNQPIRYVYYPDLHKVSRIKNGESKMLLTNCDSLTFSIFQASVSNGTFSYYPAASPAMCKSIQIKWTCTRSILGNKSDTENIMSAEVVMRQK